MHIFSTATGAVRHGLGAVVEAGLVVAIAGVLVFGAAVVGRTDPAGAADVYAAKGGNGGGGSLSATISFAGGYAAQPLAVSSPASFVVTRSVADDTVYWVYNYCWDGSGALLSTEAYPVLWGMWYSLEGTTYDFTLAGTHCQALVTIRPWTAKPLGDAVMNYTVAP